MVDSPCKRASRLLSTLGSRRPVVCVRLLSRDSDGTVNAEVQLERHTDGARRVVETVQRIFRAGASRLTQQEWDALFRTAPVEGPDNRWLLLLRLAERQHQDENGLKDGFVALPDGTAFSLRLLLPESRGGAKKASDLPKGAANGGVPFTQLPDVAKMLLLQEALREERRQGMFRTDKDFAVLVAETAARLGWPRIEVNEGNLSGLREKLGNNGGEDIFPNKKGRRERHAKAALGEARNPGTAP
jgi:hypothetical protein